MKNEHVELAKYRMARAFETQKDADLLLANYSYNSAVNRYYYAIFYAIRALLATKGLDSSKHSSVISLFHREFVKPEIFSRELARIPMASFEKRTDGDYEDFHEFLKEEVEELSLRCKLFLAEAEQILKNIIENNE